MTQTNTQGTNTAATTKPKRERKAPGPMTPTKALASIAKIRAKATADEAEVVAQLEPGDAKRVQAFLEAGE